MPRSPWLLALMAVLGLLGSSVPVQALVKIDFEQPYYVHPGMQVWDFSMIEAEGRYHIFYHGIPESVPYPIYADAVWHAVSDDFIHWELLGPALEVSNDPFEAGAVWAPDVFRSEENGLYWMAYTGVETQYVQRIAMAWSRDLDTWYKTRLNPVLAPDPSLFNTSANGGFRDPFVYFRDGQWHMLNTARAVANNQGVIAHATSPDQQNWGDQSIFFDNDGQNPGNVLESVQYHVIDGYHHLFFLEFSVDGISHIVADAPENLTFANRAFIDFGVAPEVDRFSPNGAWIFSRIGPYQEYGHAALSWVARIDTLLVQPGAQHPTVYKPHPLLRHFVAREGTSTLGNPCFGDNPVRRGLPGAEPVGNFYFASKEYYQGPLSGRGSPGAYLGDVAQGSVTTADFVVEGRSMRALVGGGDFPQTCYLALFDADVDTVIYRETGQNVELMTWRYWDLRPYEGRLVYLKIVDDETAEWGHINVDEIEELLDDPPPPRR